MPKLTPSHFVESKSASKLWSKKLENIYMRHEDVRVPFLYRAKIKEKQGVRVPFLYTFECSFLGVRFFSRLSQIQIHTPRWKLILQCPDSWAVLVFVCRVHFLGWEKELWDAPSIESTKNAWFGQGAALVFVMFNVQYVVLSHLWLCRLPPELRQQLFQRRTRCT